MKCAEVCPYGALSRVGERLSVAEVMDEVERDMPFYVNSGGGMTLSGGEVLYQADFASALLQVARQKGIHTCVDTSGYGTAEDLEKLIPYTDLFLYDIKLMDDKRHKEITGVSNKVIQENARAIAGRTGIHFRIPLIPEINDNEEFFRQLGDFAKSAGVNDIDLLPYHDYASGKYRMLGREELFYKKDLLPDEAVQKFEEQLKGYGLRVTVGG
jgi:pyruvate formate lyase activating enzyme